MTVINTNVGALTSRTYAVQANNRMQTSMERLSSGLRINSAADDAAGLAVANKMESQLRGMNQAIRNSQDGISLVQTAESGMSEISNMVIRMRELAVQMNNGVYTDSDRTNAQLEITALLAEVDKIATNSAFNQVKILDGTYSKDIRAGNTNPEVINVTIDRMNTDSLGGVIVTAGSSTVATSTSIAAADTKSKVNVSVTEASEVTVAAAQMGSFMTSFVSSNASGTYSLSGADTGSFTINASTGLITSSSGLDFENPGSAATSNSYNITVTYAASTGTFASDMVIGVTDRATPAATTTGTITATLEESASATLNGTSNRVVSEGFQEYTANNSGGTYSLTGTDATSAGVSINATTGAITFTNLDADSPQDADNDGTFSFAIQYASSAGTMAETVTLSVTDASDSSTLGAMTLANASVVSTQAGAATNPSVDITINTGGSNTLTTNVEQGDAGFALFSNQYSNATYSIASVNAAASGNLTAGEFTINATTGVVTLANAAAATGMEDEYTVSITLSDGTNTRTQAIIFDVDHGASALSTFGDVSVVATSDVAISLDLGNTSDFTMTMTGSTVFAGLSSSHANDGSGTFALSIGTSAITMSDTTNGTITFDNDSLSAGTYSGTISYIGAGGDTFSHSVDFVITDTQGASSVGTASSPTLGAQGTLSSTEVIAATSSLTATEARELTFNATGTSSPLSAAFTTFVDAHTGGTYTLGGTDGTASFTVDANGMVTSRGLIDYEAKTAFDITVTYTSGDDSYTESVNIAVTNNTADDGDHIENVDISTQAGAATAVTILDEAINQISASQAKLGAIQNRLNHNIDNLSMASMLTETARGRIVDADFARETSELSKQQILAQAATSMLAQANQSKQSVLALLQ